MNAKEIALAPIRVGRVLFRKSRDKSKPEVPLPMRLQVAEVLAAFTLGLSLCNIPFLFLSIFFGDYWMIPIHVLTLIIGPVVLIKTDEQVREYIEQNKR